MKKLQNPRGSTVNNDSYTGLEGQITVDTDRWELRLHDAETPGGHRILNLEQLILLFMSKDSEFGQVVFDEDEKGVLTRIGDRQYALRSLLGVNGINVTTDATSDIDNPKGTNADFYIGLDPDALTGLFKAGSIAWAGSSTGTADALAITLPAAWPTEDGAIAAFRFHLVPNSGASLSVTRGTANGTPLPLVTASGSTNVNQVAFTVGTIGHILLYNGVYYLIGMITPQELGITPITGMSATNVQDALEELKALIDGVPSPGSSIDSYTFADMSGPVVSINGYYGMNINKDEVRLASLRSDATRRNGRDTADIPGENLTVNHVVVAGEGVTTLGLIKRDADNKIWFSRSSVAVWSPGTQFDGTNWVPCGSVADSATGITCMANVKNQVASYSSVKGVKV